MDVTCLITKFTCPGNWTGALLYRVYRNELDTSGDCLSPLMYTVLFGSLRVITAMRETKEKRNSVQLVLLCYLRFPILQFLRVTFSSCNFKATRFGNSWNCSLPSPSTSRVANTFFRSCFGIAMFIFFKPAINASSSMVSRLPESILNRSTIRNPLLRPNFTNWSSGEVFSDPSSPLACPPWILICHLQLKSGRL